MVETENQDGEMEVFEVAYTFGWEPLQQYLVKFPDGRMQVLPTCWDARKKGVVSSLSRRTNCPGRSSFLDPFDAKLGSHVADCHSTNLRKVFEPSSQTFATTYSEMSVRMRILSRSRAPARRIRPFGKGLAKHARFRSGGRQQYERVAQIESCAKCHARRGFVHPGHHAGSSFSRPFSARSRPTLGSGHAGAHLPRGRADRR